jgi:hypothetical protein
MSVAFRGLTGACAAALTLGIVTQPTGSAAQAPGHERVRTASAPERAHDRVAILQRPQRRFEKSIRLGHRRVQRIQAAHAGGTSGNAAVPQSEGGFPSPESVGVSSATLEGIAACESGGDPTAVSVDGTYHGLYQFDYGTWASVGGSGDPAAASPEEQTYRAALLYSRSGSSAWPICGS